MRRDWILVIGGGKSQLPFIEAVLSTGYAAFVVDRNETAPGRAVATRFAVVSTFDADGILDAVADTPISGLIAYSAFPQAQAAAARCREHLGAPGPRSDLVRLLGDKCRWKERLAEVGVLTPLWGDSLEQISLFENSSGRVVAKPRSGGFGSQGVHIISQADESLAEFGRAGDHFFEAYIEGEQFNISGYVNGSECHPLIFSRKIMLRGALPHGFQTIDPACDMASALWTVVEASVGALSLRHSFFSFDVIVRGGTPYVIDAGLMLDARLDFLLRKAGVPIYRLAVLQSMGQDGALVNPCAADWCLKFHYAKGAGVVSDRMVRSETLFLEKEPGDSVAKPTILADAVAVTIAQAPGGLDVMPDPDLVDYNDSGMGTTA